MHELENSTSLAPLQFEEAEWQVWHNAIRACYQCDPWMPNDSIEFSLLNRITHSHCCGICANYKEHMLITQVMEENNSSAWWTHEWYEKDLIHLGWTLAHEGGQVPPKETRALTMSAINQTLEQQNHQLKTQLEALRHINTTTNAWCKELTKVLNDKCLNILIQSNKAFLLDNQCKNLKARCISLES